MRIKSGLLYVLMLVLLMGTSSTVLARGSNNKSKTRNDTNEALTTDKSIKTSTQISMGVATMVYVLSDDGQQIRLSSDLCPVPYCTTGDQCGTETECALQSDSDYARERREFIILMVFIFLAGIGALLYYRYKDR